MRRIFSVVSVSIACFFVFSGSAQAATTISGSAWPTSGAASAGTTGLSVITGGTHVGSVDVPPDSSATGYIEGVDNAALSFRVDGTTGPLQTDDDYWVRYWVRAATNETTLGADGSAGYFHSMVYTGTLVSTAMYLRKDGVSNGISIVPVENALGGDTTRMSWNTGSSAKSIMPLNGWSEITIRAHKNGNTGAYGVYFNRALIASFENIATFLDTGTFTADDTTDVLTKATHGMTNGERVTLTTTGTLPSGLALSTTYYVVNSDTNTFQLSATSGGAAIDILDTGTGTHTYSNGGLRLSDLGSDWTFNLPALSGITWQLGGPINSSPTALSNNPLVDTFASSSDWVTKVYPTYAIDQTNGGDYWTQTAGALTVTPTDYHTAGAGPKSRRFVLSGSSTQTATLETKLDIGTLPFNSSGWATLFFPMLYIPDSGELDIIVNDALGNPLYQIDVDGGFLKEGGNSEAPWTHGDRYFLALHFSDSGAVNYSLSDLSGDVGVAQTFWSGALSDWTPGALGTVEYVATRAATDIELDAVAVARWLPITGLDSLSSTVAYDVTPTMVTPNKVNKELFGTQDTFTAPGANYPFRQDGFVRSFGWAVVGQTGKTRQNFTDNVLPYMTYTRGAVMTFLDGGSINDISPVTFDEELAVTVLSNLTSQLTSAITQLIEDQNRVWVTTMIERVQGTSYTAIERQLILDFNTSIRSIATSYPSVYYSDVATDVVDHSTLFTSGDDTHFNAAGDITYASFMVADVVADNSTPYATNLGPASYVNGSTIADSTPSFTFVTDDADEDNVTYQIQIDDNSDFSSTVVDVTSSSGAPGASTYTVTTPLTNGSYYWRVRVADGTATSSWFTANSGSIAFVVNGLSISVATTSINGSGATVNRVTLTFSEAVDITDASAGDGLDNVTLSASSGTCTIDTADYSDLNTTTLVLPVTCSASNNTAITVGATYATAGTSTITPDGGGDEMANGNTIAGTDGAAPAIVTATFYDASSNDGKLDLITVVFSEVVAVVANASADWAVSSPTFGFGGLTEGTVECNSGSAGTSECDYNFTTSTVKTSVGDLALAYTAGTSLQDASGNQSGNLTITSASTPAFLDGAAPEAVNSQLSIAGGTGTGGAYKIGDTVTITWNAGNTSDVDTVTADLSAFGGGVAVVMTDTTACGGTASNSVFEACYTIVGDEGIDNTGNNVTVDATDTSTNNRSGATTAGATVDTIAPTLTAGNISVTGASGTGGAFKNGDTAILRWDVTTEGETDTLASVTFDASDFEDGSTSQSGTLLGGVYTGALLNALDSQDDASNTITVTVVDNAGNSTGPTTSSASYIIDTIIPTLSTLVYQDALADGTVERVVATFSEDVSNGFVADKDEWTFPEVSTMNFVAPDEDADVTNATTALTILIGSDANETGAVTPPTLSYTDTAGTLQDDAGNAVANFTAQTISDTASPVIVSAVTDDIDTDGTIDVVTLTFSELVDVTDGSALDGFPSITFTPSSGSVSIDVQDFGLLNTATLTLGVTGVTANDTALTFSPTYTVASDGSLIDASGNEMSNGETVAGTDGAGAVMLSSSLASGSVLIPASDDFTLTFSEPITTGSFSLSPSPALTSGSFTYVWADGNETVSVSTNGYDIGKTTVHTITAPDASSNTNAFAGSTYTLLPLMVTSSGGGGGGGGGGSTTVTVTLDTVTLTSPNGGESLAGGTSTTITWTSTGNIDNVILSYSVDGGTTFTAIVSGIDNDGSYTWTLPNTATSSALVQITGRDAGGAVLSTDPSNAVFAITLTNGIPETSLPDSGTLAPPSDLIFGIPIVDVVRENGTTVTLESGNLFRGIELSGVYLVDQDGSRRVFPSESVYFSYYANFNNVIRVKDDQLRKLPMGKRLTMAPGRMIKIQSNPNVYQVHTGAILRLVPDEATARSLYGDFWNKKITDIEPTFWGDYTLGEPLSSAILSSI